MKTVAESFALTQWLDEYPENLTYADILQKISNCDDADIQYIDLVDYEPQINIVRHIEATKRLFNQYVKLATQELQK